MKIDVYVLCKNEIKLAPFMVDYWKALADDIRVFVYDGISTDGTREYLSQFDFINIIDFEPDALDDFTHRDLKNSCWKQSRGYADFVMVCDFDETIFSYDVQTLRNELQTMKDEKYSIIVPMSFNVISDEFPKYDGVRYLHEIAEYGFNDYMYESKPILFDPNLIEDLNVVVGGHTAFPTGEVKWYKSDSLFLIHCKFLGFDYYTDRLNCRKISQRNISAGLMAELDKSFTAKEKEYNDRHRIRFSFNDIKDNFLKYYSVRADWRPWKNFKV